MFLQLLANGVHTGLLSKHRRVPAAEVVDIIAGSARETQPDLTPENEAVGDDPTHKAHLPTLHHSLPLTPRVEGGRGWPVETPPLSLVPESQRALTD